MNLKDTKQIIEQLELLNQDFPKTLEALEDEEPIPTWGEMMEDAESLFILFCLVAVIALMIFW
tara:strand:- start:1243 stop:1431 length:189 start_codon:yes stop_codon:yes gene_type:complete